MADLSKVTGVKEVIRNMHRAGIRFALGVERGLKRGGLFGLRKSKQVVPVLTGNLKNSGDVRSEGNGFNTVVKVGYWDTDYAIYVHERRDLKHKEGKQSKFLESPMRNHSKEIYNIVADSANGIWKASNFK